MEVQAKSIVWKVLVVLMIVGMILSPIIAYVG